MYWHPVRSFQASTEKTSFKNRITCRTNLLHLNQILLIINCHVYSPVATTTLSTPWSTVLLQELIISHLVRKLIKCYGNHRCITHGSSSPPLVRILSQINPVHPFHPASLRYSLILSFHLPLGPPSGLFPAV